MKLTGMRGCKTKKPSMGEAWIIFSATTNSTSVLRHGGLEVSTSDF